MTKFLNYCRIALHCFHLEDLYITLVFFSKFFLLLILKNISYRNTTKGHIVLKQS